MITTYTLRYQNAKMDGVSCSGKKIKPEIPIVMISGHGHGNGHQYHAN
jgi:hypothetical protein